MAAELHRSLLDAADALDLKPRSVALAREDGRGLAVVDPEPGHG